jgi:hypothetical protein
MLEMQYYDVWSMRQEIMPAPDGRRNQWVTAHSLVFVVFISFFENSLAQEGLVDAEVMRHTYHVQQTPISALLTDIAADPAPVRSHILDT